MINTAAPSCRTALIHGFSVCQEREPASAREEIFEQLKLIREISIWKQSKPRIMEIGRSPKSRKCSVLHGGKAGEMLGHSQGVIADERRCSQGMLVKGGGTSVCICCSQPQVD